MTTRPRHDEKLPDGFVRAGWRKVKRGGVVRFQSQNRQDDGLQELVGKWVYCEIVDMWGIDILIHPNGWQYDEYMKHARGQESSVIVPTSI